MEKRIFCIILSLLLTLSTAGCSRQDLGNAALLDSSSANEITQFDELTSDWFYRQMSSDPLSCNFTLERPETYHISCNSDSFLDLTYEDHVKQQDALQTFLSQIKDIPRDQLDDTHQLDYDLLVEYYTLEEDFGDYYYYQNLLSPTAGIPSSLPVLLSSFSFRNTSDIDLYLSLLDSIDIYFGQLFSFAKKQAEMGLLPDEENMTDTITFCSQFSQYTADHLMLSSFQERIQQCSFLSAQEQDSYISQNSTLVKNVVLPSYLSLSSQLTSLLEHCDNNIGLSNVSKGKSYYRLLVKYNSGTDTTPSDLFQQIAKKREKDLLEMGSLFSRDPSLASRFSAETCPLTEPADMIEHLQDSIRQDFPLCKDVSVSIQPISSQLADVTAPAYYLIAPIDLSGSHRIFYDPSDASDTTGLFTTMAHEGFPGHLYQTAISYQYGISPVRSLLSFPGYTEGWATYAEYLSYDYAGISPDTATLLSLNDSVVLSLYASADIGIHYLDWDRKTLWEFLSDYGIREEDTTNRIYQQILADPANYLRYYVGYMNFSDLQKEYLEEDEDHTLLDFHQTVLKVGPAPFSILKDALSDES